MSSEAVTVVNKVVAITGGGRGIGLAIARALQMRGARVAVGDLDGAAAGQALGAPGLGLTLDVRKPDSYAGFLAHVQERLGPLDVLINNAGIMPIGAFAAESEETARRLFEVNVFGYLTGMKLALATMLPRGSGHIVNIASIAGREPAPGGTTYCASKAAIVMLTESARVEHRNRGVTFTCVMPSFTRTDLIAGTQGMRLLPTVTPEDVAVATVRAIELRRPDVFVPRQIGWISRLNPLLGRRIRDATGRLLGADRTFLDIDQDARRAYQQRIDA